MEWDQYPCRNFKAIWKCSRWEKLKNNLKKYKCIATSKQIFSSNKYETNLQFFSTTHSTFFIFSISIFLSSCHNFQSSYACFFLGENQYLQQLNLKNDWKSPVMRKLLNEAHGMQFTPFKISYINQFYINFSWLGAMKMQFSECIFLIDGNSCWKFEQNSRTIVEKPA